LALNSALTLEDAGSKRSVLLRDFFKAYKVIDKTAAEIISEISFDLPQDGDLFNFEKVSKRTWLDIASVNSAIFIRMQGNVITSGSVTAGGVGPVPLYLKASSALLNGQEITEELVEKLCRTALSEISPISDARGAAAYKSLLLTQLLKAHFIKLFPALNSQKILSAPCKI
jgi:xanthine dehydrogenase small subunit